MTGGSSTPTVDEVIAGKKRRSATWDLVMDPDEGSVTTFRFEAMGRLEFRALRHSKECQPTREQIDRHVMEQKALGIPASRRAPLDNNPDEFPPRYLAATCVSPRWTVEEWREFLDSDVLNDAEFTALMGAALSTQATRAEVPSPEA